MQTKTTTVDLEAEQAKRTQKARTRTWDIDALAPGHFRVSSQSNGQQTYQVFYDPAEEWRCTCKDFSFWGDKGIRCKHCEAVRLSSPPYPVMVLRNFNLAGAEGVKVRFSDDAEVFLSIRGRYPCSACGDRPCDHFRLAVPYFARWKWETAQSPDCSWGPTLLQSIGIIPPYIVRPDLVTKQSRWAPFGRGEEIAPGVRVWHTVKGKLFRFSDNGSEGHVYVGRDHPDGHTPCLICQDGCDHAERALALANGGSPPPPEAVEETEAPEISKTEEVTDKMATMTFEQQLETLASLVEEWAVKRDPNVKGLYTSGEYVTHCLNRIFTPAGWSFTILNGPEVVTINQANAYVRLVGRLTVRFADGSEAYQDDIGIWPLTATGAKKGGTLETTAAERYETVEKAARTDCLKNAARNLGTCFAPMTDLELQGMLKREAYHSGDRAKAEAAKPAEQHKADLFGDDDNQAATPPTGNGNDDTATDKKAAAQLKVPAGNGQASEEQRRAIANLLSQIGYKTQEAQDGAVRQVGYDPTALTSEQAAEIISRLQAKSSKGGKATDHVTEAVQKYS